MSDETFVIWSYEHDGWWRPGRWGYTDRLDEAGCYTKAEADAIVADANIVTVNEVALPSDSAPAWDAIRVARRMGTV